VAPVSSGVLTAVQVRPSELIHTVGSLSWEPAETKPTGPAATASTRLEPPVSFTSCALVQVTRSGDHQTSRECAPPGSATVPELTYPCGPLAAGTTDTPARSCVMPFDDRQLVPSEEVSTRGPGPTASHPCGPWVTADSSARSVPADTWVSEETRVQGPSDTRRHTAG